MRKILAATFLSLDGVMQAPGGPDEDRSGGFALGGWIVNYWDEATEKVMGEVLSGPFDLLLGRKTYDIFAGYWPKLPDNPIGKAFNECTKYVATRSGDDFTWNNTVVLRGDVVAQIAALKASDGPPLLIQGSGDLVQTLLANDLIDELRLMVFPLLLGPGKRLFADGTHPAGLKLTGGTVSSKGVFIGAYVPAGEIVTGTVGEEADTRVS